MKRFSQLFVLLLSTCTVVFAQQERKNSPGGQDKMPTAIGVRLFPVGGQLVAIPEPEGFVEATSQSKEVQEHFIAIAGAELELLAVHLSPETLEQIEQGERANFDVYTIIYVSKALKDIDISPELYKQIVALTEQNASQMLDPNSPATKVLLKELNKSVSDRIKREATVAITQPIRLGEIVKTADTYSQLLLMSVNIASAGEQQGGPMLCGASLVRVRNRVLLVNTYKNYRGPSDIEFMRAFTKKWVERIVKANRT